ncbi:LOW QUALITY PROTEIN: uncharacterized protein C11orf16 homolog [Ctenodactylus gundi]
MKRLTYITDYCKEGKTEFLEMEALLQPGVAWLQRLLVLPSPVPCTFGKYTIHEAGPIPGTPTPCVTVKHAYLCCASDPPCLHIADPARQCPGDAADTWVLARREPDGYFYLAQIKAAPELERLGILLVEFEVPLVIGPVLPDQRQSVVSEEDVVQLSPSTEYSLQPGDKVLASWEPDRQRYGPDTVLLGSETSDHPRTSKEEEITVHFWNGKTAKVPLDEVKWVPPTIWKKAVERMPKPCPREHARALLWAPCCSLLGSSTGCITNRLPPGPPFLGPPVQPLACCQLLRKSCLFCCPLKGSTWWPLPRTSDVPARELPESEQQLTAQLVPTEGPNKARAVCTPMAAWSSSSTSPCEDLERDPPQRLMVNSAVNTDPILPEKLPRQSGLRRPMWRYWWANGPEPCPGKPEQQLSQRTAGSLRISLLPQGFHYLVLQYSMEIEKLYLFNRVKFPVKEQFFQLLAAAYLSFPYCLKSASGNFYTSPKPN